MAAVAKRSPSGLYVARNTDEAKRVTAELESYGVSAQHFPAIDVSPYERLSPEPEMLAQRQAALAALSTGTPTWLVTAPKALAAKLPLPETWRANLLTLSAPEATVLVGGLRVLGANYDGSNTGVFTERPGQLTNDFFVNLLELGTTWTKLDEGGHAFRGVTESGKTLIGSRVDLLFGSNSELRAVAEFYGTDDAPFVEHFVAAWQKVMELDRFDIKK